MTPIFCVIFFMQQFLLISIYHWSYTGWNGSYSRFIAWKKSNLFREICRFIIMNVVLLVKYQNCVSHYMPEYWHLIWYLANKICTYWILQSGISRHLISTRFAKLLFLRRWFIFSTCFQGFISSLITLGLSNCEYL